MDDFYARVGSNNTAWTTPLDLHGIETENSNGIRPMTFQVFIGQHSESRHTILLNLFIGISFKSTGFFDDNELAIDKLLAMK